MVKKAEANVKVGIDERQANVGLNRLEGRFSSFGANATQKFTAAAAGLTAAISTIRLGVDAASAAFRKYTDALAETDAVDKMALRVDASAAFIDKMHFAAERTGGTIRLMDVALTALARRAAGTPQVFERWGIATRNANGELKSTEELLATVANKIQNTESQAVKLAIAQDVMSEAGRKLVPTLDGGAAGLEELGRQAEDAALVLTAFERQAAATVADRLGILETQSDRVAVSIGAVLAPAIEAFGVELTKMNAEWIKTIRANQEFIDSGITDVMLSMGAQVIPAIGGALRIVGVAFGRVQQGVLFLSSILEDLWSGWLGGMASVLGGMESLARMAGQTGVAGSIGSARFEIEQMSGALADGAEESVARMAELDQSIKDWDESIERATGNAAALVIRVGKAVEETSKRIREAGEAAEKGAGKGGDDGGVGPEAEKQRKQRLAAVNRHLTEVDRMARAAADRAMQEFNRIASGYFAVVDEMAQADADQLTRLSETFARRREMVFAAHDAEIISTQRRNEMLLQLDQQLADERAEVEREASENRLQAFAAEFERYARAGQQLASAIMGFADQQTSHAIRAAEKRADKEIAAARRSGRSQEEIDRRILAVEEELEAKRFTLEKAAFERNKALQLVNAIINTATGITAALAIGPPAGYILAAITAAAGAVQIATIASSQYTGSGGGASAPSVGGVSGASGVGAGAAGEVPEVPDIEETPQAVTVNIQLASGTPNPRRVARQLKSELEVVLPRGGVAA